MYARIAPGSWLIERDIVKAREVMNLSSWEEISADKQDVLKAKIVREAKSGEMPPVQYLALHWTAKLSPGDVQALAILGQHAGGSDAGAAGQGDPVRGKAVFEKRCTGCHALDADREGPRLAGVFGRKAGSVAGFTYSAGLKKSGLTWDEANLDKWLSDPDVMVPDNAMSFSVAKALERRDIIAFLKQK
jgi:cytochrome c